MGSHMWDRTQRDLYSCGALKKYESIFEENRRFSFVFLLIDKLPFIENKIIYHFNRWQL